MSHPIFSITYSFHTPRIVKVGLTEDFVLINYSLNMGLLHLWLETWYCKDIRLQPFDRLIHGRGPGRSVFANSAGLNHRRSSLPAGLDLARL